MAVAESKPFFETVTIIGVGLLGASVALAMKKRDLCARIVGSGRSERNLQQAQERGIIDDYFLDPAQACRDSDLVLLATPITTFEESLKRIYASLKSKVVVTDVGSVKGRLVEEMEKIVPARAYFVGAHPIAGKETSGIDGASADLFELKRCFITPTVRSHPEAIAKVVALWKQLGMLVELVDPHSHDRIFSLVSHLPHLVAYSLVNAVEKTEPSWLNYAGSGFRDTTRIALSSPHLWEGIASANRNQILEAAKIFKQELDQIISALENNDASELLNSFVLAQSARARIQEPNS